MKKQSPQKFKFWNDYSYGTKLIKGVTRDQVIKELTRYPLLMKHYKKNTSEVQTRVIDTLMKEPSPSDCPGFIYGFKEFTEHNKNPYSEKYEIKMGRTKRQVPQNRIYEWEQDDGHQYVEIFTIRSEFNNKLEALVHLFFAYARKLRIINGKRRIEWFTFQEKALNAAVTSLINQLMEKIHHLGNINETHKTSLSYDLGNFCSEMNEKITSIEFLKKRLIIVGLKQSGKSVLKAMLNGQELKVIPSKKSDTLFESQNLLQIQTPNTIDFVQSIIKLNQINGCVNSSQSLIERFRNSFILWSSINSVQEVGIPSLVVTQSDLLSSQMIGFRKALQNFLQYIKLTPQFDENSQQNTKQNIIERLSNFKLLLIVSKIQKGHQYSEQKLKKYFLLNREFFQPHENKILLNASIFFLPSVHQQGKLEYNVAKVIRQIQNYNSSLVKSISFEYSDSSITKICQQTIHYAYQEAGQKFGGYFKSSIKKIAQDFETQRLMNSLELNETEQQNQQQCAVSSLQLVNLKLNFIESVENLLSSIKSATKQQQVLINLKRIHLLLSIQGSDSTISQLLAFCQCMLKLSSPIISYHSQGQDFDKKQDFSSAISPIYLSNSVLFTKLDEKISQTRQEIREQVNAIIQNELKKSFEKTLYKFYTSLQENSQSNKQIFNRVYDVLFRMMNIDSAMENQRVEKKLALQKVSNELLEQQILIKSVNELIQLSGGKGSAYFEKLEGISKLVSLIYQVSREHKMKTINVVSRIREAIYLATKGKRQVPMVSTNSDTNENIQQKKYQTNNKKPFYNNKPNHVQIDSETKVILNKKDEIKNERLLNYINAKKKYVQQTLQAQISQQSEIVNNLNGNKNNNAESKKDQVKNLKTVQEKKQLTIMKQKEQIVIEISDEDSSIYPDLSQQQTKMKNTQMMLSEQEFFSMPSQGSEQEQKEMQKIEKQLKKLQIQQKASQNMAIMEQDQFSIFINQLLNFSNVVKNKYSSISSLKSLNQQVLFKVLAKQSYNQFTFNFSQNHFQFDLPSITLHNSFVIIFAKKISINNLCEVDFKIHYKNRKPNKVNFIMISEGYEGVQKLKIEDNKYGKVLMLEVLRKSERKFKVHEGYFTKNKRNEKKLQDLKVKDLVQSYCRIII